MKKDYLPYELVKSLVRELGLTSKEAYGAWWRRERPNGVPSDPRKVYSRNNEWKSFPDFLGARTIAPQNREYRDFESACEYVRQQGFQGVAAWKKFTRSGQKPDNIPANPDIVYKDKGWKGYPDFLGNGRTAPKEFKFLSYDGSKEYVQKLGLRNQADWRAWAKSPERPKEIPADPQGVYKKKGGWKSFPDFLGTSYIATKNRKYRPIEEAKEHIRPYNFKGSEEYYQWAKSGDRPADIPSNPDKVYSGEKGFINWGDYLGTGRIANQKREHRDFEPARDFVRSLNLKDRDAFNRWANSPDRPGDIPLNPYGVYENKGWISWGDWLGNLSKWSRSNILSFINSLSPGLGNLGPMELYAILLRNGLVDARKRNKNKNIIDKILELPSSCKRPELLKEILGMMSDETVGKDSVENFSQESPENFIEEGLAPGLPELKVSEILGTLDQSISLIVDKDEEIVEFFISKALEKLWRKALQVGFTEYDMDELNAYHGHSKEVIKERFLYEHHGACSLEVPEGYSFKKNGRVTLPNLMQRLVAFKIKTEHSLGNWSGVGAGKTLSAILASRVIDSKITVIVALNSTIEGWGSEILSAYPDSVIFSRKQPHRLNEHEGHKYLLLNYESFQLKDSVEYVQWLVENHLIDFVVLDEIQHAKQRGQVYTKRRQTLNHLLENARLKNNMMCTLGISATPVINSLDEAVSLLKMITGKDFQEINTYPNIPNCAAVHQKLVMHGVRHIPSYEIEIDREFLPLPGEFLIDRLQTCTNKDSLKFEQIVLEAKLPGISGYLKKGTIIYTYYVQGLVLDIRSFLSQSGYSFSEYTGDNKEGLKLFINGEVDILIASSVVGTGLDGLQYVCDQLIILSLPWTHAGYHQLLGRIYRQGSRFDKIRVIVPQVVLNNEGKEWSWDRYRMDKILYKKTLGDAVLDGVIPEKSDFSEKDLLDRAVLDLKTWIKDLEETVHESA
jgi:hypothetical protein